MSVAPVAKPDSPALDRLFGPLARLRRRLRWYVAFEGVVRVVVALIGIGLAQLLLDRWLRMSVDQRVVFNVVISILWAIVVVRALVRPLRRRLPDHILAGLVDRAHPELSGRLASAVQFSQDADRDADANSPALMQYVLAEACNAADRVSFLDVLDHRQARRRLIELGGLVGVVAAAFIVMPQTMSTWFQRNWLVRDVPWPQATTIVPIGFDATSGMLRFPRGDELVISALNEGRVPKSATLQWTTPAGRKGRESMTLVGQVRWEVSLGLLDENTSFRIVGGDERTREYTVVAVDRPRVVESTAHVTPPAYTGLAPLTFERQSVLEVLAGSSLVIDAKLNKSVESARFVGSAGEVGRCEPQPDATVRMTWDDPQSGAYAFELADRDGWENRRPVRFTLKVTPDLPPNASLTAADVGQEITPRAEMPLTLSASDEYGLSGVALLVQRNDDPPVRVEPKGFDPHERKFEQTLTYSAEAANVQPGDRLRIWLEASDLDPAGPNVGKSEPLDLRVLSATDFLARLAQRELELRVEFERLVSAQRGLVDALERLLPTLPVAAPAPSAEAQQLAGLSRRQSTHASRVAEIRRGFEQILDEMRTNKVGRVADERRISDRVSEPLRRLGDEQMPSASDQIGGLREQAEREQATAVADLEHRITRQMRDILSNMKEWEGFREAVALLAEIVEAQEQLRTDTLNSVEDELDDILDLDAPAEVAPDKPPKP